MTVSARRFALIGAAGFVAPRHLRAIKDTGNELVVACDPRDSVGVLDAYFPQSRFFTEFERFDRHLEKLRRTAPSERVEYVSICSPNFLHDAHVRLALRVRADAICEKPLVIKPWNLDQLAELEAEYGRRVYTIMQLRHHPELIRMHGQLAGDHTHRDVVLTYISRRGPWYQVSWKGQRERSGGLAMNLGIHFFDLLLWMFGSVQAAELHLDEPRRMAGAFELERARVRWFLSVAGEDLPPKSQGRTAWRSLAIDGSEVEFSDQFEDLHRRAYEEILAGRGLGIHAARPSIVSVHDLAHAGVAQRRRLEAHPALST